MRLITLINDWQNDSLYFSQVTGLFNKIIADVKIENITPDLRLNDILRSAFILRASLRFFPENTIHFNFVDRGKQSDKILIATYKKQIIVSPDNGFIPYVTKNKYENLRYFYRENSPFDLLIDYATVLKLINDDNLEEHTETLDNPKILHLPQPVVNTDNIIAHIIYIDTYGNIFLNISKKKFLEITKDKKVTIKIGSYRIFEISENYNDVGKGDLFAIFNSSGLIEIGQRNANLAKLLDLKVNEEVLIEIKNKNTII